MPKLLLSMMVANEVAQAIEDLLLSRSDLVSGFSTSSANGHGSNVMLTEDAELVAGHAPRTHFRSIGEEQKLRELLAAIKSALPQANIYYWLTPVIEAGRL